MSYWTKKTGVLPAMAAFAVILSGCDLEVLNPGAIQDADLTDPALMPVLVAGVSAEYNDFQDDIAFDVAILSDDMAGTGSYSTTQLFRQGFFDFDDSEGNWAQTHEANWAADQAIQRLQEVADANDDFDYLTSPDAARAWMLKGFANVRLGENFCHAVYGVSSSTPRTAAFDTAIAAFNEALTRAAAAGSAADAYAVAARAGIAQAQVGLAVYGSGSWATADAAAQAAIAGGADVDWFDYALYNASADVNIFWSETWGRAEFGVFRTLAQAMYDNDADPRVAYKKCGEWNDPTNLLGGGTVDPRTLTAAQLVTLIDGGVTATGDCTGEGSGAHQGADGEHAHYKQTVWDDRGSDIPRASAEEMLLIRAEAAMNAGNFGAMMGFINQIRTNRGLAAYSFTPTVLGTLDYPHDLTSQEAIDVLDRERYATLWMQGRRLYDMDRWDHPFLAGGAATGNWVVGGTSFAPRPRCQPVPRTECLLNANLAGDPACP